MRATLYNNDRLPRRKRESLTERIDQARAAVSDNVRKFFNGMTYNMTVDPVPPEQQVWQHVVDYRNQPDPTRPYCIVEYIGKSHKERAMAYARSVYHIDSRQDQDIAAIFARTKAERQFQNYGKAIAHLTKVKLNIIQEDEEYRELTPCKIVEGCYTRNNKPHAIKTTEFPNVGISMGRDDIGGGQPREQRQPSVSPTQTVAAAGSTTSGGSWSTTVIDTAQRMVTRWDELSFSALI